MAFLFFCIFHIVSMIDNMGALLITCEDRHVKSHVDIAVAGVRPFKFIVIT